MNTLTPPNVRRWRKIRSFLGKLVECLFLCFLFVAYILPFYWMLISSLKSVREAMASQPVWWPEKLLWGNYVTAWNNIDFTHYGKNSIILCVTVMFFCMLISVPSAYAFARKEFRLKKPLFAITLADMMIPGQCIFVPIFIMYSKLGLVNTYSSIIIITMYSGATILFLRNAFMQVDNELIEAAHLDGASEATVMFRVVFPMMKPVMITQLLFAFLRRWNDYFWNVTLTTNEAVRTLPWAVQNLTQVSANDELVHWEFAMAGTTLLMAPMLIAYIFANKKIKGAFAYTGIK